MACSTIPQSAAERARTPILSRVQESGIAPCRLTKPYVGRKPLAPQKQAGVRMEPEVSEPSAYETGPAATAAPEPLDEPPDQYCLFHGLSPGPCRDADAELYPPPPASSTIDNFPIKMAFALARRLTTVAS